MSNFNFSTDGYDPDSIYDEPAVGNESQAGNNRKQSEKRQPNSETKQPQIERNKRKNAKKEDAENKKPSLINFFIDRRTHIFIGVLLIIIAAFITLASISHINNGFDDQSVTTNNSIIAAAQDDDSPQNIGGALGAYISQLALSQWLGIGSFALMVYIWIIGLSLLRQKKPQFWALTFKCLILSISLSIVFGFITYSSSEPSFWGGQHGYHINDFLITTTGMFGAILVNILVVALVAIVFLSELISLYKSYNTKIAPHITRHKNTSNESAVVSDDEDEEEDDGYEDIYASNKKGAKKSNKNNHANKTDINNTSAEQKTETQNTTGFVLEGETHEEKTENSNDVSLTINTSTIEVADEINNDVYDPTAELSRYRFPTLDLLMKRLIKENSVDQEEQEENKERITKTLRDYDIEISHIEATVGPTVTLYEIIPAEGVRIAKIKRLEDDIALSLAALGIRIIAPIPGKGTIGIEVPNKDPQTVSFRSIIASKKFQECKYALPMAMGATISNDVFIADLAKMPHLLVAGATGQGKSVGLNAIIASLLYKKHPSELKFVLIDPKMVEFSLYSKLERHYLAKLPDEDDAIITDPMKVVTTLNSLCVEMDNRYNLLKDANVRSIAEYNDKFINRKLNPEKGHKYLPYIVMIVDEFADLIMTAGKEVETPIARIAQKARAVGMHMIIATQRPSTNVITGIIKANFPGRIAFRVSQMVDSKTILDCPGANQLIGRGDMLFSHNGSMERVQCAFIDTPEVEAICDCIDGQIGYEHAYYLPEYFPESDDNGYSGGSGNGFERDSLFEEAARFIITSQTASTSSLQRRFSIGYNRAGKIMDQMEAAGIVGPAHGGKPRQVLMDSIQLEHILHIND